MKSCVCLIFVLIAYVCDGFEEYLGNGADVWNPDNDAEITRPCPTFDLNCIRWFFAKHSYCTVSKGPVPDPFYRSQSNMYAPRVNISVTLNNIEIRGLNGRVEEFYINENTNNLVIAVEFRGLFVSANTTYFIFHRRAKEPVVTTDFSNINYSSVVMTAVIPNIDDIHLDHAEVVAYSNDATPRFNIGPGAAISSDPQVPAALAEFLADVPTDIQELFLTDASFYLATYIQYNICDFGLKVL